jgi:RND family efflux transporter MFP subunit
VQMNDALLRAQLRQQQAGVQTAEANAARDDAALGRAQELKTRGFLSQAGLDTALANQRASQANLASARAALSETQTRLSQATIKAPVSGLVISRSVTRGQIIGAGTELFRIVRDGRLELDAQVPETDLALVRAGQTATVSSDQVGDTTGRVRIVTPEVNPETRLGVARIALPGGGFRPGMFARARINVGDQPAVTVPTASVLYRQNKPGVFVLRSDNTVRFQIVTVAARNGDRTAVTGLNAGAQVNQISSWSIRNPIPIILMFTLLTLAGIISFMGMRINNNPDIDFPLVAVTAVRPGAAPSEMEVQVTRLIEDSLSGLSGVRHINSQVTDGVSSTTIEFELGTDTERATNDVRNAMSGLRADLPQDMQEPSVQRIDITGDSLITWVVRSPTTGKSGSRSIPTGWRPSA